MIVIAIGFVGAILMSSCSGGSMFSKIFRSKDGHFFKGVNSLGNEILGRYSRDEQADANAKMDKILEALKNKDKEALKALFSLNAIAQTEKFDQNIIDLFDYFQGDFVSYNDWSAVNLDGGINDDGTGRNWKVLYSTYDVETSKQKLRFAIQDYVQDTADANNIGIHSLYIIKMEDDTDPNFAYRGDDKYTPGINIGIKNVLPIDYGSISTVSVDE